ncbi:MAG: T9SS type A sorting domain-containing protein [Fibrobacteria bacterium]|nr:T9SS type A sorting domain-containing protein [Fibrobacteria bacterium]
MQYKKAVISRYLFFTLLIFIQLVNANPSPLPLERNLSQQTYYVPAQTSVTLLYGNGTFCFEKTTGSGTLSNDGIYTPGINDTAAIYVINCNDSTVATTVNLYFLPEHNMNIGFYLLSLRQVPDLSKAQDGSDYQKDFLRILDKVKKDGFSPFRVMFPYPGTGGTGQTITREAWEEGWVFPGLKTIMEGDSSLNLMFSLSSYPRSFIPNRTPLDSPAIIDTLLAGGNYDVTGSREHLDFEGIRHARYKYFTKIKIHHVPVTLLGTTFNTSNRYWQWTILQQPDNSQSISSCDENGKNCNYANIVFELEDIISLAGKQLLKLSDSTDIKVMQTFLNRIIAINHYPFYRKDLSYWSKFPPYGFSSDSTRKFSLSDVRNPVNYERYILDHFGTDNTTSTLSTDYNKSFFYRLLNHPSFGAKAGKWMIEIGNEPDAQGYFWGTIGDFESLFIENMKAARILQKQYPKLLFGGPGFTSEIAIGSKSNDRQQAFCDFAEKLASDEIENDFLSYHIYYSTILNDIKSNEQNFTDSTQDIPWDSYLNKIAWITPKSKRTSISEWNVASAMTHKIPLYLDNDLRNDTGFMGIQEITRLGLNCNENNSRDQLTSCILESKGFMNYLFSTMVFNYHNKVDDLFLFRMMDDELNGNQDGMKPTLGLFTNEGEEKMAYQQALAVNKLVRNGFTAIENEYVSLLRGKDNTGDTSRLIVLSKKGDICPDTAIYRYIDGSVKPSGNLALPANRWMELEYVSTGNILPSYDFLPCDSSIVKSKQGCMDSSYFEFDSLANVHIPSLCKTSDIHSPTLASNIKISYQAGQIAISYPGFYKVVLFDIKGNKLFTAEGNGNDKYHLNALPGSGLYILTIQGRKGIYTQLLSLIN